MCLFIFKITGVFLDKYINNSLTILIKSLSKSSIDYKSLNRLIAWTIMLLSASYPAV